MGSLWSAYQPVGQKELIDQQQSLPLSRQPSSRGPSRQTSATELRREDTETTRSGVVDMAQRDINDFKRLLGNLCSGKVCSSWWICVPCGLAMCAFFGWFLWSLMIFLAVDMKSPHWQVVGYAASDQWVGSPNWCQVQAPAEGWTPKECLAPFRAPLRVKALTYNLFWWNLYGVRHGNGGSATNLIRGTDQQEPYELMGFQECENLERILEDANMAGTHKIIRQTRLFAMNFFQPRVPVNPHAVAIAYRIAGWQELGQGIEEVADDRPTEYYGRRCAMWVRLRHIESGSTVFFMNHHGPTPVQNPGGLCGPDATAYHLLKVIGSNAAPEDAIIVVGDFNAGAHSATINRLSEFLDHVASGTSFGGVDNIFGGCANAVEWKNLGNGGSDHNALSAVFSIPH